MARLQKYLREQDVQHLIDGKIRITDNCLDKLVVWATKEQQLRRWRKDAKVWAKELVKTQPENDRPPGFEPDDDNSYPIEIDD